MQTKVYRYGCLAPIEGVQILDDQMRLAYVYRNRLVGIERRRRVGVRLAIRVAERALGVTDEMLVVPAEERSPALRALLKKARIAAKDECDRMTVEAQADLVRARPESGLYWGTYGLIEAAVKQASSGVEDPQFRRWTGGGRIGVQLQGGLAVPDAFGCDPCLRKIVARIERRRAAAVHDAIRAAERARGVTDEQRALPRAQRPALLRALMHAARRAAQAECDRISAAARAEERQARAEFAPAPGGGTLALDRQVQLKPVPPEVYARGTPGRSKAARSQVRIRAGSRLDGSPVWVTLPVVLHRPMPEDGTIKWVVVVRERVATNYRYSLHITVETPEVPASAPAPARPERVAIDLGWRLRTDGIRVGYWRDGEGAGGELRLPSDLVEQMRYIEEEIHAKRILAFNAARNAILAAVESVSAGARPVWLRDALHYARQWRAPARLGALAQRWRDDRFDHDEVAFAVAAAWSRGDRHLWRWEANQRDRVLAWRDEIYRAWADDFARRHGEIVIEDWDLRRFIKKERAERDAAEDGTGEKTRADAISGRRHLVAPGTLRSMLLRAAEKHGARVVKHPAAYTTTRCHACGCVEPWDQARELEHTCVGCGATWDQDANACMNLLASPLDGNGSAGLDAAASAGRRRKKRSWGWRSWNAVKDRADP